MTTRRSPTPAFVITLQAAPGVDAIRALRWLLKISLRDFGFRCLAARESRTYSAAHHEDSEMPATEIENLRAFAATARRTGFGPPGFKCDGTTGNYGRIGDKSGATMNGQHWAATVADVMIGYQRIEKGKSPVYIVGKVSDGYIPPDREELGDLPATGDRDPWAAATWLPFWNPDTREVLLFHAANDGSRSAVANLTQAYADHREAHPDQTDYDPLIELNADHYDGQHRRIFYPQFDILDWVQRPARLQRVLPPPVKALDLTALPPPAPAIPVKQTVKSSDMDDEIPF